MRGRPVINNGDRENKHGTFGPVRGARTDGEIKERLLFIVVGKYVVLKTINAFWITVYTFIMRRGRNCRRWFDIGINSPAALAEAVLLKTKHGSIYHDAAVDNAIAIIYHVSVAGPPQNRGPFLSRKSPSTDVARAHDVIRETQQQQRYDRFSCARNRYEITIQL